VKLQRFKNITHEDAIESSFYLDEHMWDLDNALTAWKEDKVWNDTHFYPNGTQSNEIPEDFLSESTHETKSSSKRFSLSRILSSKAPSNDTKAPGAIEPFMIIEGPNEIVTNAVKGIECEVNEDDSDIYVVQASDLWKQPKYQNSSSEKMKNTILSLFGRKNSVSDNDNLMNMDEGAVDPILRPLMSDDRLQQNRPVLL
jgi:UBA-like domain